MRIKSYFAESIQDAMERARLELGADAMLVSSKRVDSELRHLGAYEVVFGLAEENRSMIPVLRKNLPLITGVPLPDLQPARQRTDDLAQELADLRKQIESVGRSVSRQNYQLRWTGANVSPELGELHAQLLASDFSDETSQDLVRGVQTRLQEGTRDYARLSRAREFPNAEVLSNLLSEEIDHRLRVSPSLGGPMERRIIVLVGASGSGKTSTLVKLAVKHGIAARIPVQIFSTDTLRLGGAEQLASYSRIIGAGFRAVHSADVLSHVIEEYKTKKLFLIDTPGYDATNIDEASGLIAFLRRTPEAEVHMVMPASLRATSATRLLQRFAVFEPSKLLLTRIDEAETAGAVLEPALRSGLPVSFLGIGQQVPEDLEEASKSRLLERFPSAARSAHVTAA
jgi:flagellar biosynthesis protein FlhF